MNRLINPSWLCVALLGLLAIGEVNAHELIVPATVQADASGEFEVAAQFEIGPGDERLAYFQILGTENVDLGIVADYECVSLLPEGTVVELELPSELTDPLQPGLVETQVVTCGVSGEQTAWVALTVVLPYEPTRQGHLWWIDSEGVYRARLDGGDPQQVVDPALALAQGSVAVDPLGGQVYWTSWEQQQFAGVIRRARIHEGDPELFTFGGKGGLSGIAAHTGNRDLYIVDPSDCIPGCGSISRIKFDQSDGQNLIVLDVPQAIAVSPGHDRMCWFDDFLQAIQCADLDGSSLDTLFTGIAARGLAIDGEQGKLYWSQVTPPSIRRANLDGSNPEDVVTEGLVEPYGVAFDPIFGKVYWSDRDTGKIQRSDPKGIWVQDLVVDLGQPLGITLDWGEGHLQLTLDEDQVSWSAVPGAMRFDLIRGDLVALQAAAGDYSSAQIACVAENVPGTSAGFTDEPAPGEGFFLLLRAVSSTDTGTYDSLGSRQTDGRDPGIEASGGDCP